MSRLFVGVVVLNLFGLAWWAGVPATTTAAAQVDAPTEQVALDVAWAAATDRLEERCGSKADHLAGVEEIEQVSNGYRARVSVQGSCS